MKKVGFFLLRTLGDVILGTALCHELKRDHPDYEIHWYVNRPYDELLENNPDIGKIEASNEWAHDMLFMEMASGKYEKIFAPYQVRGECNMWHQREETRHQHLLDFYWKRMGQHRPITERECYLYPNAEDYKLAEQHISLDVPRVAIHTTSNVKTKDWTHFDELAEMLRQAGYGCVQVGARSDVLVKGAVDLRGKMHLLELAAFLSKCSLFIGIDSGLTYMADAMKTQTISIQASTDPVTSGAISNRVIRVYLDDTGHEDCNKIRCHVNCRYNDPCIASISASRVYDEAIKALTVKKDAPLIVPVGV